MWPLFRRMNTISVARAKTRRELEAAAEIYERSGRAAFAWRPASWFNAADFLRFAEEEEIYIARRRRRIVGAASFCAPENFLHCLYVDPDAQGKGVGRSLIAHLRARATGSHSSSGAGSSGGRVT